MIVVCCGAAWVFPAAARERQFGSYPTMIELDLGRGVEHIHWGPRRPAPPAGARGAAAARQDLFAHAGSRVRIWWQTDEGFSPAADEVLTLPDDPGLVDFGDVRGDSGEEVVVVNRRGVYADAARERRETRRSGSGGIFGERARAIDPGGAFVRLELARRPPTVPAPAGRGGPVPLPFFHAATSFLEDVDGDRHDDLVVPRQRRYEVYVRRGEKFVPTIFLEAEHRVKVDTGGPQLVDPLQFEIEVPELEFRDLNGDRLNDIIARRGDRTRYFLQGKEGFASEASYELDLALFKGTDRDRTVRPRPGAADLEVLGDDRVLAHEVDIDGDGLIDHVVSAGRVVRVYFGGKQGTDFTRPHLARRFSSELKGVGSFDIDGDGLLDLVALKYDQPSLPRMIAAYFTSMSLDFEILGYLNRGGRDLARRPDRRRVLTVHLPPLRRVFEDFDAVASRFLGAIARQERFATGDIDGDGRLDAAFIDDDCVLRVFAGGEGDAEILPTVELGDLLFHPSKREWQLEELLDFIAGAPRAAARGRVGSRRADLELALGRKDAGRYESLDLRDIDGDGRLDFLLRTTDAGLTLFLSGGARGGGWMQEGPATGPGNP